MLNIALLLDSTTKYNILFSIIVKYTDNDSYLSPVAPSNGTVEKKMGAVEKKTGFFPDSCRCKAVVQHD